MLNQSKPIDKVFNALSVVAFFMCAIVGVLYSDDWGAVDSALSMASTFLGIVASVSLALIGLQVQSYERITSNDKSSTAHIRYIKSFKTNVKTEIYRVISIASPIVFGIPLKLCVDFQTNRFAVGVVACSLCVGVVSSVMLPMKYGKMMTFYLDHLFNSAEAVRKQKKEHDLEELRNFQNSLRK